MKLGWQPRKWLEKKAKRGMRGYRRATKVVVGIIPVPRSEPAEIHRSFGETGDVRVDETVFAEIVTFLREHKVQSVAMTEKILGCPHEEGIDYPNGEACPDCPYWAGRDRWTG
jgi:hypothetical protein